MMFKQRLFTVLLGLIFAVVLTDQASALYDPGVGRFCSRDPIGYGGGKETLYSYCDSQPTTRVDPEGKAGCTVRLSCTTLGLVAEHCGIETSTDGGRTWHRWHVRSPGAGIFTADTCDVRDGRITTPIGTWPWRDEMEWIDPTGQLCGCLDREAVNIKKRSLVYFPNPSNYLEPEGDKCKNRTSCNSNYSTHCMMKRCGITAERPFAPGWNHRMSHCTEIVGKPFCWGFCGCNKWEPFDSDWCSDKPNPPVIQGTPIERRRQPDLLWPFGPGAPI